MNERIKLLAEQAGIESYPAKLLVNTDEEGKVSSKWEIPLEKFAELIVQECGKVIVNGGYRNPALGEKHPLTPPEIAKMIEEHFGVEE